MVTAGTITRFRWVAIGVVVLGAIAIGLYITGRASHHAPSVQQATSAGRAGCGPAIAAFKSHDSGIWLTIGATVSRTLADAHGRSTHQRFILRCPSRTTVLIDNNVDVGQRVPASPEERVVVHGQYIWNRLGGLIHDTHHSTSGGPDGWILVAGRVYG
jgi:hypothetical protein